LLPPAPEPTKYPTCDQSVRNVPGDYPTIQAAINAASIGDTVKIAAGTYNEDLTLVSGICLEGAGIDQTIISKSGASGIIGNNVSYVIIKGLTVQNSGCAPGVCGGGSNGGGIQLSQSNDVTIQSCRLTGNASVDGGGISISQSTVTMDHCLIDDNTANNVGAGMVKDAASTVSLTNVTVANNNWANHLGNGGVGGIQSDGSGLQMANSIVWGNNSQNFSGNGSGVSNSDIGGWSGGTNNVTSNPDFVSATDYHLQGNSTTDMGLY
jgi:pectin methylesterase-like acyl-CoA thioesterase